MRRFDRERLRRLRNDVDIALVVRHLGLSARQRGQREGFLCPLCRRAGTVLDREKNLARCFRCRRSFNPIDLVLAVRSCTFPGAVEFLDELSPPC